MTVDKIIEDPHGFNPKIREIETEIASFFAKTAFDYTARHPHISKLLVYFYTRKKLTQRNLKVLTGLSAGSISKAVRQLVKMNVIVKDTIPGTHTKIYIMERFPFSSPRFFMSAGKFLGNIETELKEMKKILEENVNDQSYDKIYATITQILRLIPLTDSFMSRLDKKLKI
jgi:DNA-binding transcriptional regulator GbsR (MarR family)